MHADLAAQQLERVQFRLTFHADQHTDLAQDRA